MWSKIEKLHNYQNADTATRKYVPAINLISILVGAHPGSFSFIYLYFIQLLIHIHLVILQQVFESMAFIGLGFALSALHTLSYFGPHSLPNECTT